MIRLLLIFLLSVSIPVTTLAATVSMVQCEQMHAMTGTLSIERGLAQHSSQPAVDETQHGMHHDTASTADTGHCNHCQTGHCASVCVSTLASGKFLPLPSLSAHAELIISSGGRTTLAHSLGLLRPPA